MSILAVDAGRSEVEAKWYGGFKAFPSAVAVSRELKNRQGSDGDLEIHIGNKKWFVGKLAEREGNFTRNNFQDSKADEILLVQVIASAIYAGLTEGEILLGVLVPVKEYTSEEITSIRHLLRGVHKFTYFLTDKKGTIAEERPGEIIINKVLIMQEGVAAYWSHPQEEPTQTIDFGAKTINFCYHDEEQSISNSNSGTLNKGWELMKDSHELKGKKEKEIDDDKIDEMAKELVDKTIEEILGVKEKWSKHTLTQVFGGVAKDVFPHLQNHFDRCIIYPNPRNGNVNGLYGVLEEEFMSV